MWDLLDGVAATMVPGAGLKGYDDQAIHESSCGSVAAALDSVPRGSDGDITTASL